MKINYFFKTFSIVSVLLLSLVLGGCATGDGGDLIGVRDYGRWTESVPFGMVQIKQGSFLFGQNDQDITFGNGSPLKNVTVRSFYMDDAEISNSEYRQFVNWVRDSIAHQILGHVIEDKYGVEYIDWKKRIAWENAAVSEELEDLFVPENRRLFRENAWDVAKFQYSYQAYNFDKAIISSPVYPEPAFNPANFLTNVAINIYPDTLVWTKDISYSYNDPQTMLYFSHPAYYQYPVVGVSWNQAQAFCNWRTNYFRSFRKQRNLSLQQAFRLPTEVEWEYAARGGRIGSPYPWGGPSVRNNRGCLLANFKPGRGNYIDDGVTYTAKTYSFNPNDFGLYNMSGNVAEWTKTTFHESTSSFVSDLNPEYNASPVENDPQYLRRRVVRGGSWKDIAYFLMNGSRSYEYQDSARSTIGFRCVMDATGRDLVTVSK